MILKKFYFYVNDGSDFKNIQGLYDPGLHSLRKFT